MSHVVMQAAEAASVADAERIESALTELVQRYVVFEKTHAAPWAPETMPEPLVALGEQHGVPWPGDRDSRFLLKGAFEEMAHVLRVDRLVFFWGGGFDLGGPWLRECLLRLGALACTDRPHLRVRCTDPDARVAELSTFLNEEDYEGQFSNEASESLFSVTFENDAHRALLSFGDSGAQDHAFVSVLPQLDGEDPTFRS